jgi:hypothetical protein
MNVRGSAAIIKQLVGVYPQDVVTAQLRQLYEKQIEYVIKQIYDLLPGYRARVDETTYGRERERFMALLERACEDDLSVEGLEATLKHLLAQQRVFAGTPN